MKIKSINISWFRGSADPIELNLNLKSLVVYGENGSGKSSFVDALEHNINDGRIVHLAHEYSGKRQEKAIINTHTPANEKGVVVISMEDNSIVTTIIHKGGSFSVTPQSTDISTWDYRRTILRQNELADFIANTKGDKYSSLLPLLGLSHLEITAENLRKIEKEIQSTSGLEAKRTEIKRVDDKRRSVFVNNTIEDIEKDFERIYKTHYKDTLSDESDIDVITNTLKAVEVKFENLSVDQKRHTYLLELSKLEIEANLTNIRNSTLKLGESAEPLILEKLNVLKASIFYAEKNQQVEFDCPACGRVISSEVFSSHVKKEELVLKEAIENLTFHRGNINILCDNLQNLKRILSQDLIRIWKDKEEKDLITYIEEISVDSIRQDCTISVQTEIKSKVIPVIERVKIEVATPIQNVTDLLQDKEKLVTLQQLHNSSKLNKEVKDIQELIAFMNTLQRLYREQIRKQATSVIADLSADIARMWEILHPDEKIEDIRLTLPQDIDKAIEIGLKFYGIEQDSPRITLSEGHRNSLGLCIFLAMAKKDTSNPVILDDVIVSFDRNHRGMVGILLEQEFSERQIVVFTHDRDWYIELKAQLDKKRWDFKTLMPWENPEIGIRLSTKQFTFDDARAFLNTNPDSAGNTARKIMDIQMAVYAELLKIDLPYKHRERNDRRTSHEFLEKIASLSTKFQIKRDGTNYVSYSEAIEDIRKADTLIVAWANRASHTFDMAKNEATILINSCEQALTRFTCTNCKRDITYLDNMKSEFKQCECGNLKWKYD